MAAIVPDPSLMRTVNAVTDSLRAEEVILPGQVVRDGNAGGLLLAHAKSVGTATAIGIAISRAEVDEDCPYFRLENGIFYPGVAVTAVTSYFLGLTPGEIIPGADLGANHFVTQLGVTGGNLDRIFLRGNITGSINQQLEYQGTWDAANNAPDITTTPVPGYWLVEAGGTYDNFPELGTTLFAVGDTILYNGTNWSHLPA